MTDESLLSFPCDIPIKVFGRNVPAFRETAVAIVRSHVVELSELDVSERLSREGRFMSLTINVWAESRAHIDAVFADLVESSDVLMVL